MLISIFFYFFFLEIAGISLIDSNDGGSQPIEEGTLVVALYDYTASHDDELTFSAGTILLIPSWKGVESGWINGKIVTPKEGSIDKIGKEGLVPTNYIENQSNSEGW